MAERRHSSEPPRREAAADASKTVELEARIGRLEVLVKALQGELALRQRRETAMQAQVDHIWARIKMGIGDGV